VRLLRAGQHEAAPPVARPPIQISTRAVAAPDRLATIRGLPELVDARMQAEAWWREVWAVELATRGER